MADIAENRAYQNYNRGSNLRSQTCQFYKNRQQHQTQKKGKNISADKAKILLQGRSAPFRRLEGKVLMEEKSVGNRQDISYDAGRHVGHETG